MFKTLKLAPSAKGIALSLPGLLIVTATLSPARAAPCPATPAATCGMSPYNGQDLYLDSPSGTAFINAPTSDATIYMDGRQPGNTQQLTVSGTDMSGKYIQASHTGAAAITLAGGARADMIEGGNAGSATDITVVMDNAVLNGANDSVQYHTAPGDKAYMMGSAIFIDQADGGVHNLTVQNGSQLSGSIITGGAAAQRITVSDSTLDSGSLYSLSRSADNQVTLNNARLDASQSATAGQFAALLPASGLPVSSIPPALDRVAIVLAGNNTNQLTLNNATVTGDVGLLNSQGVNRADIKKSTLRGDLVLVGNGSARVTLTNSQLNGNVDAAAQTGATTLVISDASTVTGNVTTGAGSDRIAVINGSEVKGAIDGGAGQNSLLLDGSSAIDGQLININSVHATEENTIVTPHIGSDTAWNLMNRSMLVGNTMSDASITMSTDSMVIVTGAVTGVNTLIISQMATQGSEGQAVIGSFADLSQGSVNYRFANGARRVAARAGAWNYDLSAFTVPMNNATQGAELILSQRQIGLAHDVKGAIAGLEGAKQSGQTVAANLASRLDSLRNHFLLHGQSEGAHVWGDYLYHTGDFADDVDYHSNLLGAQVGVDWSHQLTNGDLMTGGFALAWVRNRVSDSDNQGNFNNAVYGDFYSLYGGWQQPLHDNRWSLFADGSVSLGDIRYTLKVHNVPTTTTGIKEALNGSYDGSMVDVETRAGITLRTGGALLQPYAVLGWNSAHSDRFSDAQIEIAKNETSAWHTGAGVRLSTELEAGKVRVLPWIDARYVTEFNDDTAITAADYTLHAGHNQKMGLLGIGANLGITRDLWFSSGIYTGTGDVDNSVSVQAGLSFDF